MAAIIDKEATPKVLESDKKLYSEARSKLLKEYKAAYKTSTRTPVPRPSAPEYQRVLRAVHDLASYGGYGALDSSDLSALWPDDDFAPAVETMAEVMAYFEG